MTQRDEQRSKEGATGIQDWIVRAFVDDFPIKLLALMVSLALFFVVHGDKNASTTAYVKVIYELAEDRVLVSEAPNEVRVTINGPAMRLGRLDDRALEPIRVDLERVRGNELRFDPKQVRLPIGLRVGSISPAFVRVQFDARLQRDLPIQPILEGQPAEGFRVAKLDVEPDSVRVDGPKSIVERMTRVPTRPLPVAGAKEVVRGQVELEPAPSHVRYTQTGRVTVEATIQPAMVERKVETVVSVVREVQGRWEFNVNPRTVRLMLRGPSNLVQKIEPKDLTANVTASSDDIKPPRLFTKRVVVGGLPQGVAAEALPDTVILAARKGE